jgi:site-specific DNA-cytosine methylase
VTQTLDAVLHKGQMMPEKNRFPVVLQSTYAAPAIGTFIPTEVAGTLTRHNGAGSGETQNAAFVQTETAVRRLTPVECERLQGFPDGWTDVSYKGKPCGDGHRYKALGNSMAVNCMRWIGRRIELVEAS